MDMLVWCVWCDVFDTYLYGLFDVYLKHIISSSNQSPSSVQTTQDLYKLSHFNIMINPMYSCYVLDTKYYNFINYLQYTHITV